jgi:2-polyprenyl-3-methyl-5-hydroxy-6-metoxy-1,4-benzoquinol methylase
MLQLVTAGYKALDTLRSKGLYPLQWNSLDELEPLTNRFMKRFLDERLEVSWELGPGFFLPEMIDRLIRTNDTEYMDNTATASRDRLESVQALDRMNRMTLSYDHQSDLLLPVIRGLARPGKPVCILELAAGSGGLAFALAERAAKEGIELRITASDIVPEMVSEGNRQASERHLPVRFRRLNAFDLNEFEGLEPGSMDMVVISQSLHHFSPGQLALMIAESSRHGASFFVGIDGYRSLLLTGGVPLVAALQGNPIFMLDGLTSARKFYSTLELDIIAGIATRRNHHEVTCSWPLSVLLARF